MAPRDAVVVEHRKLSGKELEAHVQEAFDLERQIKGAAARVASSWWELSESLYRFHEGGYWKALGYDTLEEFLAQPELGVSRRQFFQMTKMWRDFIVVKQLPEAKVKELEPSKAAEVAPSIMRGDVQVDQAMSDVKTMGARDLRKKYRPSEQAKHGQKPDGSTPLDASTEPQRVQCPMCSTWVDADTLNGAKP